MKKYGLGLLLIVSVLLVFVISSFVLAAPHFYNNQTSVVTTTSYAPGKNYGFQINVTQVNSSVAVRNVTNVTFTFGGIEYRNDTTGPLCIGSNCYAAGTVLNFTLFNDTNGIFWINFTDLGAGAYNFQWKANETLNYIGNSTASQVFNISKNMTVINLYLNSTTANQTNSIEFGNLVNVTATLSNITYGNATIYILKDGVLVGNSTNNSLNNLGFINASMNLTYLRPGTYNFSAVFDGNANYTAQTVSYALTVRGLGTTNGTFFALSNQLRLNWTNSYTSNLTLIANKTLNYPTNLIMVDVYNGTTSNSIISENYSQSNSLTACSSMSQKLSIGTANNSYNTSIMSFNSTNTTEIKLNIGNAAECKPGRYTTGLMTFRNITFLGDNFNASLIIDVPVTGVNINLTGVGNFSGVMTTNSTYYHSYFFYTDGLLNATGVTINVSWSSSSQNLDLFLFDNNGVLKAEAINATQPSETLTYSILPSTSAMWELRIYGNNSASTSYNGNIIYTGVNATSSQTNQTFNLINLGTLNASNANQTITTNITLNNQGNVSLPGTVETKEIYFVKRFTCETTCTGERNFTFVVPDSSIVSRIKANVTWVGDGNYTLNLYKPLNETVDVTSLNSVANQNFTGAWQERFNETAAITKGVWKLQVKNNTVAVSPYNASVILHLTDTSVWISSNYTTFSFNRSIYDGGINTTNMTYQFNLTVQNNTLDGTYEGYLKYTASTNATLSIPFAFTVGTSTLVINNTLQSDTILISSNIGLNRTLAANMTINNTGSFNLPYTLQNSTNKMLILGGTNKNISFDYVVSPANSIPANSFGSINITFDITTVNTSDTTGVYEGYIFFNTTNNTNLTASAHPYQSFNITLRMNLTNQLEIKVADISSFFGNKSTDTNARNTTVYVQVSLSNGTVTYLNMSNFDKAWLQEGNVTNSNGVIPSSGNLTFSEGKNPIHGNVGGYNAYAINLSVPANTPGGLYKVHLITNAVLNGNNFTGESNNGTLIVNNAGFYLSNYSSSFSISNTSSDRLYVNVTNYGTQSGTTNLGFVESCSSYSVTAESASAGCGSVGASGANFTTLTIAAHNSNCLLTFKITGVSGASACSGNVTASSSSIMFNNFSVSVTVSGDTSSSSSTTTTSTSSSSATTTSSSSTTGGTALKYLEVVQPDKVLIIQGNTNSTKVIVKNVNNTKTQNISLTVEDINQSWVKSIDPATANLITAATNTSFTVAFSIPNSTEVKDYNGTLKATSSYGSATTTFILRVLPGESKKLEINSTFELIKLNFTKIQNELNDSKQKGINVSTAEKIFNEANDLFSQAQAYINSGDYFSAFQLFDQIKAKIESTRSELTKSTGFNILGAFGNILNPVYIIIAVAAVGGLALLYLFWPTKLKYAPSVLQPKQQKEQPKPKVAEENVWEKLKKKWEEYYKKRKMLSPKQYYKYKTK